MDWIIFWKDTDEEVFRGPWEAAWQKWLDRTPSFKFNKEKVFARGHTQCFDQGLCRDDVKDKHFFLIKRDSEIKV